MGVESEEKPLYLYLVIGARGGFSPAAVLVADSNALNAVSTASNALPFLVPTAVSPMDMFKGYERFDGEWGEPLDSAAGPRVLAEYYE